MRPVCRGPGTSDRDGSDPGISEDHCWTRETYGFGPRGPTTGSPGPTWEKGTDTGLVKLTR